MNYLADIERQNLKIVSNINCLSKKLLKKLHELLDRQQRRRRTRSCDGNWQELLGSRRVVRMASGDDGHSDGHAMVMVTVVVVIVVMATEEP